MGVFLSGVNVLAHFKGAAFLKTFKNLPGKVQGAGIHPTKDSLDGLAFYSLAQSPESCAMSDQISILAQPLPCGCTLWFNLSSVKVQQKVCS